MGIEDRDDCVVRTDGERLKPGTVMAESFGQMAACGNLGNLYAVKGQPTDRELAADLRAKIEAALNVVVTEMNKAESASGLRASFQIARDGFGRNRIADISIMRLL